MPEHFVFSPSYGNLKSTGLVPWWEKFLQATLSPHWLTDPYEIQSDIWIDIRSTFWSGIHYGVWSDIQSTSQLGIILSSMLTFASTSRFSVFLCWRIFIPRILQRGGDGAQPWLISPHIISVGKDLGVNVTSSHQQVLTDCIFTFEIIFLFSDLLVQQGLWAPW